MSIRKYEFVEFNRKFDVDVVKLIYFVIQRFKCITKNNIVTKSINSKLIILRNSAHIVDQRVQLYTHFEIYSQIWICWIQTKIWCWRRQIDLFRDSTNLNDQMKLFIVEISFFHLFIQLFIHSFFYCHNFHFFHFANFFHCIHLFYSFDFLHFSIFSQHFQIVWSFFNRFQCLFFSSLCENSYQLVNSTIRTEYEFNSFEIFLSCFVEFL